MARCETNRIKLPGGGEGDRCLQEQLELPVIRDRG